MGIGIPISHRIKERIATTSVVLTGNVPPAANVPLPQLLRIRTVCARDGTEGRYAHFLLCHGLLSRTSSLLRRERGGGAQTSPRDAYFAGNDWCENAVEPALRWREGRRTI